MLVGDRAGEEAFPSFAQRGDLVGAEAAEFLQNSS